MNAEFCMDCGARFEYSLKKPNFCSSCGNALGEVAQASQQLPESAEKTESFEAKPLSISKLEYEIEGPSQRVTFGDLISQASQDPSDDYVKIGTRPVPPKVASPDIQKQILQECQSVRGHPEVSE